ncbi:MAG: hypothetical protein HY653_07045 [Acidobacteria bacterium]|nr:hypothetical protein [Acidobacteriota bacterium]
MRKVVFLACLVCLLAFASGVQAQSKVDSQWKCEKPAITHSIDVGDQVGHTYVINQTKCTATKGEIGGVQEKVGGGAEFVDVMPGKSKWHGLFIDSLASGDQLHINYEGSGTMANGEFTSGSNTWTVVGGTGKYKGAKGKGSCKGKGNPDGTAT